MDIRQISADERTALMFPLQAYAFDESPWTPEDETGYRERTAYLGTVVNLIAEEDGQTLACAAALPMRQNVRGEVYDMAGVSSVATHPAARRRGLVRQLLDRLLPQMRDRGCAVSALYPFRPSFYGRFGYVGLPRVRTATFAPGGLGHLLRADLPGTVERLPMRDAFDEYDAFTRRLLGVRHGFSVFDPERTAGFREDKIWVALARSAGEVVGAVTYTIDGYGGSLLAGDLLTTGVLGRSLLLQYFAHHVDQVARVVVKVGAEEVPELWGTDLQVQTEGRADYPGHRAPMARVLDLPALTGMPAGPGAVTVEVVDDALIGGTYRLDGDGGRLTVTAGGSAPAARLTAAGISGLVYGVLDPAEVVVRGLGTVDDAAIEPLGVMFPRRLPYVFAKF